MPRREPLGDDPSEVPEAGGPAEKEQTDDFNPEARCKSVDQATAELLQQLQEAAQTRDATA